MSNPSEDLCTFGYPLNPYKSLVESVNIKSSFTFQGHA